MRWTIACCLIAWGGGGNAGTPEESIWTEPITGISFVRIPPGEFWMGSPLDEPSREEQESRHRVHLPTAFYLGRFEVTQGQWRRVMGSQPSRATTCGASCPVESVSFVEIQEFLRRLNRLVPHGRFRLPTEAEWEYACRAGTTTAFSTGPTLTTDQANFDGRYPLDGQPKGRFRGGPTPVGSFSPNPWGLYDMHGNVWEWCADNHCPYPKTEVTNPVGRCDSGLRVIRGGSWAFGADSARCALRYTHHPQDRGPSLGFRVARD